jgi:hydrogenase/urease accessory protein HupE
LIDQDQEKPMLALKIRPNRIACALACAAALSASVAHAHPGDHGHAFWEAFAHMLTEPDHLAGIALAVLVAAWGLHRLRDASAARARRPQRSTEQ